MNELYQKAYDILREYLPNPDEIIVGDFDELRKEGIIPRRTIQGVTIGNEIYFRNFPPNILSFVHELIHIAKKPRDDLHEEVWGYNISNVIVWMIEKNVDGDPFKLYCLSREDVMKVLNELGYKSFEDFYMIHGIIPFAYKLKVEDDSIKIVKEREFSWISEFIIFLNEIIGGAIVGSYECERVLRKLLEITKFKDHGFDERSMF